MYKWKIDIILKSGKEITVYYKGDEDSTSKVANKVLVGNIDSLVGFGSEDGTKNIFVRLGEIATASIYQA